VRLCWQNSPELPRGEGSSRMWRGGRRIFSKRRLCVRVEHELRGRVWMVEGERRLVSNGERIRIEGEDINAICVVFNEATNCNKLQSFQI